MNIAVFASGGGSNFQAIAESTKAGNISGVKIALLVCDTPGAHCLDRAKKLDIPIFLVERKNYSNRDEYEKAIIKELDKNKIKLVVLAGYMRMVGPELLNKYKNAVLNIHPALLPSFKGTEGIKDAFEYGVKLTGPTVHFVDGKMDNGPIILQAAVEVSEYDTAETLAEKIHRQEHKIYPEAIKLFAAGKLKIEGRRVKILS